MILGASHIVLTTGKSEEDEAALVARGWKTRFRQSVAGRQEKVPFLSRPSAGENLTLLDRPGSVSIELIEYKLPPEYDRVACLVLPSHGDSADLAETYPPAFRSFVNQVEGAVPRKLPGGESYLEVTDSKGAELALRVGNIGEASRFYVSALGFESNGKDHTLSLRRPFPQWCLKLSLLEDSSMDSRHPVLDAAGVWCLSFVSSNLLEDRKKLLDFPEVESSGPMGYQIGGKLLDIEIFRVPGGLYIELLQAARP